MRDRGAVAVGPQTLARLDLQCLLRDYPELLAVFRAHALEPRRFAAGSVRELVPAAEADGLLDGMAAAIAWRSEEPCSA